jgi:hypothetical protein
MDVLSGKDEDLDLLLLKAESLARARWCYLTESDEGGADIYWWKFEELFNDGLWRERTERISPANWKAMSAEAYDCIVSCLGSSSATKILKGVPNRRVVVQSFCKASEKVANCERACGSSNSKVG